MHLESKREMRDEEEAHVEIIKSSCEQKKS